VVKEFDDEEILKDLVEKHFRHTGSEQAKKILGDWENQRKHFHESIPYPNTRRALGELWEKAQGSSDKTTKKR
jgi:glutamate synthase (NADPH/NADH) large chain